MFRASPRNLSTALLGLLLLVGASGCFRAVRAWELRGEMLDHELRDRSFPVAPAEGLARIGAIASLSRTVCRDDAGCSACTRETCFALEPSDAGTRVVPDQRLSEESARTLWQPLDAESLTQDSRGLDERVEAALLAEEARFVPRFGLTFGAFIGIGPEAGVGLRLGVRRWHEMHVLSSLVAEYEYLGTDLRQAALLGRLELSRWSEFSAHALGAPSASVGLVVGATGMFGPVPFTPGFRAGFDLHLNEYTGGLAIPFFIELAETTTWSGATPRLGARFEVGFGL